MYDYKISDANGQTIATGQTNSHTADTALSLVSDCLPHEAIVTDCQYDRQEQGCWSYDCTWEIDTPYQVELSGSRVTVWTVCIW